MAENTAIGSDYQSGKLKLFMQTGGRFIQKKGNLYFTPFLNVNYGLRPNLYSR